MKKILSIIIVFILFLSSAYAADFGIRGEALNTDIIAFIDEQPIPSYNINGFTYVVCEDLSLYGFSVVWEPYERKLFINRDKDIGRGFPSVDTVNVKKEKVEIGTFAYNVYNTDIITYFNNEKIDACNVNGKTLMNIEYLVSCGIVVYDNGKREIKVDLAGYDEKTYNKGDEINLINDKIEGTTTYTGEILNGQPNGYGVIKEEYEYTNGLMSTQYYYTSGYFKNGIKNGYIHYRGRNVPHNGSDRRVRDYYSLSEYKDGEISGYSLSLTYCDGIIEHREERNGNFKREIVVDPSYKYGYRIEKEGTVDSWDNIVSYSVINAPTVEKVLVDGETRYVFDVDNNVYAFGKNIFKSEPYSSDVPVLTDENSIKKHDDFTLDENKLYRNLLNGKRELISDEVSAFSANSLYLMFMKKDASVYTARLNFEEGSGNSWIDNLDLSVPVKVFENAKAISNKGRYLVIDENNTLWSWSSPYYKTKYENDDIKDNPYTVDEPVKIAEDVVKAECASKFIAYIKNDGALYINKEVEEGENVFGITEETKITDNVKDFSVSQNMILIVKNDGTLYTMGKTGDCDLGIPFLKEALSPTEITIFGR